MTYEYCIYVTRGDERHFIGRFEDEWSAEKVLERHKKYYDGFRVAIIKRKVDKWEFIKEI